MYATLAAKVAGDWASDRGYTGQAGGDFVGNLKEYS